jgi:hypothetical protein
MLSALATAWRFEMSLMQLASWPARACSPRRLALTGMVVAAAAVLWGSVATPAHAATVKLQNGSDLTFHFVRRDVTTDDGRWRDVPTSTSVVAPDRKGIVGRADTDWSLPWASTPRFSARYWSSLENQDVALDLGLRSDVYAPYDLTCTLRFYSGDDVRGRRCDARRILTAPGRFGAVLFKVSGPTSKATR